MHESQAPNEEIVRELRCLALQGASARDLVKATRSRLGITNESAVPVLWYFAHAFKLPLKEILPMREWLELADFEALDAELIPRIKAANEQWKREIEAVANAPVGAAPG